MNATPTGREPYDPVERTPPQRLPDARRQPREPLVDLALQPVLQNYRCFAEHHLRAHVAAIHAPEDNGHGHNHEHQEHQGRKDDPEFTDPQFEAEEVEALLECPNRITLSEAAPGRSGSRSGGPSSACGGSCAAAGRVCQWPAWQLNRAPEPSAPPHQPGSHHHYADGCQGIAPPPHPSPTTEENRPSASSAPAVPAPNAAMDAAPPRLCP